MADTAWPGVVVIHLDVDPAARMPRDAMERRWLGEVEQSTGFRELVRFGGIVVETRWCLTSREGWLWEDRARFDLEGASDG
jgi:hypothetical protein